MLNLELKGESWFYNDSCYVSIKYNYGCLIINKCFFFDFVIYILSELVKRFN